MDTTDLQIKAYDKNAAGVTETYNDAWKLSPRLVDTVYTEPTRVWSDVIHISDNSVNYSRSGISTGNIHPVSIQAVLDDESANKSGNILITDSKNNLIQKIHFRTNSNGVYNGFIGLNQNWTPDTYTINMKISDKIIEPVTLQVVSDFDEEIILVKQSIEKQLPFIEISHSDVTITNSQDKPLISVSGFINESKFGEPISLSINGNEQNYAHSITLTDSGNYHLIFPVDSKWKSGKYDVSINYYETTLSDTFFIDNTTLNNISSDEDIVESISSQNDSQSVQFQLSSNNNEIMLLQSNDDSESFLLTETVEPQIDHTNNFVMAGTIQNHDSDESAVIQIFHESELVETINVLTNNDNQFSIPINIPDNWASGVYTAKIIVGEFELKSKTFVVHNNDVKSEIISEIKSKPVGELNISQSNIVLGYFPTEVIVSGNVTNYKGHSIQLVIDNGDKSTSYQLLLDKNGHFSTPVHIDNTWKLGDYDVQGIYFGELVGASQFTITKKQ